jgi:hypothetical protein
VLYKNNFFLLVSLITSFQIFGMKRTSQDYTFYQAITLPCDLSKCKFERKHATKKLFYALNNNSDQFKKLIEKETEKDKKIRSEVFSLWNRRKSCSSNYVDMPIPDDIKINITIYNEFFQKFFKNKDLNTQLLDICNDSLCAWDSCYAKANHVRILLLHGADVNTERTDYYYNALNIAIERKNIAIIKLLLSHPKIDPNKVYGTSTALIRTTFYSSTESIEILQLLLNCNKVNVNLGNENGTTALHQAAFWNNKEAVQLLLKHPKINPDTVDTWNEAAISKAHRNGNKEIKELLAPHTSSSLHPFSSEHLLGYGLLIAPIILIGLMLKNA